MASLLTTQSKSSTPELSPGLASLPSAFRSVVRRWNHHNVTWALLRNATVKLEIGGDIDVLVHPRGLREVCKVLQVLGFAELPSGGRGTHQFFLGRLEQQWIYLDIVTEIAFGRYAEYPLLSAGPVLSRRVALDGDYFGVAPTDEYWLAAAHCILDKQRVSAKYRELFAKAPDGPSFVREALTFRLGRVTKRIPEVLQSGDLQNTLGEIQEMWGVGIGRRVWRSRLARIGEKLQFLRRRRGVVVATLGPDGAGKSTLARLVQRELFFASRVQYLGLWKNMDRDQSALGRMVAIALRPFRAWAGYAKSQLTTLQGTSVILDRSLYDAWLPIEGSIWKRWYMWIIGHCGGDADLVVWLDAPGEVMFARKGEKSAAELEIEREGFRDVATRVPVPVLNLDATRKATVLAADVVDAMWALQRSRLLGRHRT